MRHLRAGRKLNRSASHRKALMANMATSILDKERIRTTVQKAKEVRGVVERLITYGKRGGLHAIRLAAQTVKSEDILKKLFSDIAPSYKERSGGYTRILKLGQRSGDNASMAIIELVGRKNEEQRKKPKKKQGTSRRKPAIQQPGTETAAPAAGETPAAQAQESKQGEGAAQQ